jgi:hypothetical protein
LYTFVYAWVNGGSPARKRRRTADLTFVIEFELIMREMAAANRSVPPRPEPQPQPPDRASAGRHGGRAMETQLYGVLFTLAGIVAAAIATAWAGTRLFRLGTPRRRQ